MAFNVIGMRKRGPSGFPWAGKQEQNMNCSWSQDHKAWYLNKVPFTATFWVAHPLMSLELLPTGAPDTPS